MKKILAVLLLLAAFLPLGATAHSYALPPPTLIMAADKFEVIAGDAATIMWGAPEAAYCVASGGWTGKYPVSGSEVVVPKRTTTYSMICTDKKGNTTGQTQITITVKGTSFLGTWEFWVFDGSEVDKAGFQKIESLYVRLNISQILAIYEDGTRVYQGNVEGRGNSYVDVYYNPVRDPESARVYWMVPESTYVVNSPRQYLQVSTQVFISRDNPDYAFGAFFGSVTGDTDRTQNIKASAHIHGNVTLCREGACKG